MHARSLLIAPIVAVTAVVLVGAIIQTGQQARAGQDAAASRTLSANPSMLAERDRIDALIASARACDAGVQCTNGTMANRYDAAIQRLRTWPPDERFAAVRAVLAAQFEASARVHRELSAAEADGSISLAEQIRVERAVDVQKRASDTAARARRDIGIMDQQSYRAAQTANERSADAILAALDED